MNRWNHEMYEEINKRSKSVNKKNYLMYILLFIAAIILIVCLITRIWFLPLIVIILAGIAGDLRRKVKKERKK